MFKFFKTKKRRDEEKAKFLKVLKEGRPPRKRRLSKFQTWKALDRGDYGMGL